MIEISTITIKIFALNVGISQETEMLGLYRPY